jgi:hypothetical protein
LLESINHDVGLSGQYIYTFWERLSAAWGLWELVLALWDGQATETDTLLSIEDGTLPDKGLDATSTTIDLVKGDLADNLVAVVPSQLSIESSLSLNSYATHLRSFLTCSIFSGRVSAKRSFKVCTRAPISKCPKLFVFVEGVGAQFTWAFAE